MKKMLRAVMVLAALAFCAGSYAQPEKTEVHVAVGGKSALYYLPLSATATSAVRRC